MAIRKKQMHNLVLERKRYYFKRNPTVSSTGSTQFISYLSTFTHCVRISTIRVFNVILALNKKSVEAVCEKTSFVDIRFIRSTSSEFIFVKNAAEHLSFPLKVTTSLNPLTSILGSRFRFGILSQLSRNRPVLPMSITGIRQNPTSRPDIVLSQTEPKRNSDLTRRCTLWKD